MSEENPILNPDHVPTVECEEDLKARTVHGVWLSKEMYWDMKYFIYEDKVEQMKLTLTKRKPGRPRKNN